MRIRKRPLEATSFGKPELCESRNGDGSLHRHAVAKSNPGIQDHSSSLLSPASINIKQDHSLLAGSGYVATHRPPQKQLPDAVSLQKNPYMVVSSGFIDGKGLMMGKGEGNPKAMSVMDVHHHEVKHMHMLHDGVDKVKGINMEACKELGPLGISREADKLAEACKKASHDIAGKGSALNQEIIVHTDPAVVGASDYPRKVRPLQLILSSDYFPTTAKLPLPLCPTRSSSTMSCMPPPPCRKFDWASPCGKTRTPLFSSPAAGSLNKQIADVKSRVENMSRSSHTNSDKSAANLGANRSDFKSCGLLQKCSDGPVTSWQGNRRPRSDVQGGRGHGRGLNRAPKSENQPEQKRKKLTQTKRKVSPCISVQAPTSPAHAGNGGLMMQDCRAAPIKNKSPTKKKKKEPLLLSTSAGVLSKMIGSLVVARSLVPSRAAHTYDDHVCSVTPEPGSDLGLQLDSMRCRRKDGREWQCKAQVVKAGAPFCHYHTLKMREKHAASVARKLLLQLHGGVKVNLSCADWIRSSNKMTNKKRKIRSSSIAVRGRHRGGFKEAGDKEEHEDEQEKEKGNDNEREQQKMLEKQLLVEGLMLRRRWRKKCKPCIRRLHDIHERAGPAATDGLDYSNPCAENTYNDSPAVRSGSPLPECLLNTDPFEWRSDLPYTFN